MLVPALPLPVNLHRDQHARVAPTRWLVRAAGDLAGRQHGVVGRDQLHRLGAERWVIDALARRRVLRPVHRGVYAVGHGALTADGRRLAALLACSDGVLGRRSAAAVFGWADHDERPVDLAVAGSARPRRPGIAAFRSASLGARDVTTRRGLAVTRPARTLLDLATVLPAQDVRRTADTAMRSGCTPARLREALDRARRRRGSAVLEDYLATRRASALRLRSELERRSAELLLASALPAPAFNTLVQLGDQLLELDVWWSDQRVALELDGRAYHEGVVAEIEDERRARVIRGAGVVLHRAAWWDVTREPGRMLGTLGRDLARSGVTSRR